MAPLRHGTCQRMRAPVRSTRSSPPRLTSEDLWALGTSIGLPSRWLAQAAPDDLVDLQKALVQEHDRAELLARELTIHRHLEMLLTLRRARAATARFRQPSGNEHSEAEEHLQQEHLRLKQAAESGAAELCKVLSGDR